MELGRSKMGREGTRNKKRKSNGVQGHSFLRMVDPSWEKATLANSQPLLP